MSKLVIIGGGPAGYVAAIVAAQQGEQVILVEQKSLGGTCLNEGCMPTKSFLESAGIYSKVKNAEKFGVQLDSTSVSINWSQVLSYKNDIVKKLVNGIGYLMNKNKINVIIGAASFITSHRLLVDKGDSIEEIDADKVIIAAGSEPIQLPFARFDGEWIIDSRQALNLSSIPKSIIIIGGGVIGCEFASIYSRMGTKVTIVEMANQLLPGEDPDIVSFLTQELEEAGVKIYTEAALKHVNRGLKEVTIQQRGENMTFNGDYVLVSVGRKPRVNELGLEKIGVSFCEKGIHVNENMQTSYSHIYACGDVIGGIQLAHVAFHEGTVAANHACGHETAVNYQAVPRCIYTAPEIASVGLTEKEAKREYHDVKIGEFPFAANGKALILNEQNGKVKIMIEPEYQSIIGVSIIGPRATELIGQATLMLHTELTVDVLENFVAAHPSLGEAVQEAILGSVGQTVHF
ncbi:dihydrolipoamide dehydrogenase [Bacillus sp. SA1-12]|uniref:dihydrolipoyl dehydrogenase n=1 Tax=Bacillus sp. SA1-12 TaxID=1455638 RepID=UPI000626E66D|nr:dihydrolipoyl dehydrogenase [Bacillus sp. SA1-12]KKI91982.1 dihydrolipoamide dehydrogenase [Bacillus sp. SA1-12]